MFVGRKEGGERVFKMAAGLCQRLPAHGFPSECAGFVYQLTFLNSVWQAYLCLYCLLLWLFVCFSHLLSFLVHISSLELGCGYKLGLCMYKYVESYGKFVFGFYRK